MITQREILGKLRLTADGMAFSEELKIEAVVHGMRFLEVPIQYRERWGPPKLSSWRDGTRNMVFLALKRFQLARETRSMLPNAVADGQTQGASR